MMCMYVQPYMVSNDITGSVKPVHVFILAGKDIGSV